MTRALKRPAQRPDRLIHDDEARAAYIRTFDSPERYLVARGCAYATHVVGGWYEVGSVSDGMCGRIELENPWTTEYTTASWSAGGPVRSQSEAREAAKRRLLEDASTESPERVRERECDHLPSGRALPRSGALPRPAMSARGRQGSGG